MNKMDCKLPTSDSADSCAKSGRPSHKNEPYGMSDTEYSEIVAFLDSPQADPVYPIRMRGTLLSSGSGPKKCKYCKNKNKRKRFRIKCFKFTVEDGVLYRFMKFGSSKDNTEDGSDQGLLVRIGVAKQGDVNEDLFKQFHHDKGHIGQRQGRETIRRH